MTKFAKIAAVAVLAATTATSSFAGSPAPAPADPPVMSEVRKNNGWIWGLVLVGGALLLTQQDDSHRPN